jgi:hypothetical protein
MHTQGTAAMRSMAQGGEKSLQKSRQGGRILKPPGLQRSWEALSYRGHPKWFVLHSGGHRDKVRQPAGSIPMSTLHLKTPCLEIESLQM